MQGPSCLSSTADVLAHDADSRPVVDDAMPQSGWRIALPPPVVAMPPVAAARMPSS